MSLKYCPISLTAVCIALVLVTSGCGTGSKKVHFHTGYFDLEEYMDGQVILLWKTKATTTKEVFLNGKTEQRNIAALDSAQWRTELSSFIDADINKPAYIKRYSVDTINTNDSIRCIDYKALDDKLRTRELKVYFRKNDTIPVRLEAELKSNKIFYHSQEYVSYTRGISYVITGKQDVIFAKADTFAVHGEFK